MPKILIVGHARHGKDTAANIMCELFDLKSKSSSLAAAEIFIFDKLKDTYDYKTIEECWEDRVNRRALWYNLITEFNTPDKLKLTKAILQENDIYIGLRNIAEVQEAVDEQVFDWVIGVFDKRKKLEATDSFDHEVMDFCDFIIENDGTLEDLQNKISTLPIW
jgi:dephospho-CoA kinase